MADIKTQELYEQSLDRWPEWRPVFRLKGNVCYWTGPKGGEHVHYGVDEQDAIRQALREIASWSLHVSKDTYA